MLDGRQIENELTSAREARLAAEAAGCAIEALIAEMQQTAWNGLALIDESFDPHLFQRRN